MAAASNTFVCEECLTIDYHSLVTPVPLHRDRSYYFNKTCCNYHYLQGCAVCELLFRRASFLTSTNDVLEIKGNPIPPFRDDAMLMAEESFSLSVWDNRSNNLAVPEIWCVPSAIAKNPVGPIWDQEKARTWLQQCIEHHSLCNQSGLVPTDISLIDCVDMTIVAADGSSPWIALSYVWGLRPETSAAPGSTTIRSLCLAPDLPRTIQDAVIVTQRLGYRYLWVDEYCIDQKNESRRQHQISRMDEVYRGADLTIVAAAGEDKNYGLPGVNKTPRKRIKAVALQHATLFANPDDLHHRVWDSKWFTRAWTFQEGLLSRRTLLFTDYQTLLCCCTGTFTEGLGEFLTTVHRTTPVNYNGVDSSEARSLLAAPRGILRALTSPENDTKSAELKKLSWLYSQRSFTFDTDALNAFRGVLQDLRSVQPSAYNLCGLPFCREIGSERDVTSWTRLLPKALVWFHRVAQAFPERRPSFPSWSWVGWNGIVALHNEGQFSRPWAFSDIYLENVHLESQTGNIIPMADLWQYGNHDEIQEALDTVSVIAFTAPQLTAQTLVSIEVQYNAPVFDKVTFSGEVITRMGQGIWSCFLLSYGRSELIFAHLATLLLVQWEDDDVTAERVDLCYVSDDGTRFLEKTLGSIQDLEWRRVRLV